MKTTTLLITLMITLAQISAQDYQISFTGTGASSTVDMVEVQNLTQNTYLTLSGEDVLHLVEFVGIDEIPFSQNTLKVYPNPVLATAYLEIFSKMEDDIRLEVNDMMGKVRLSMRQKIKEGTTRFTINNLPSGVYIVNVKSSNFQKSTILISQNMVLTQEESIAYFSESKPKLFTSKSIKGTKNLVEMQYNEGDRLLIKGITGDYSTVKSIVPTASTTEEFEFFACTDMDNNSYTTVIIDEVVWMAEDLRTTHYPNGDVIPNITDNDDWENLEDNNIDDAYCFQDNNSNSDYGALYTYAAAIADNWERDNNPGQGVCPDGWHIATKDEWSDLRDFLGGQYAAGGKMKETGTLHWDAPNEGADNSSAFTALGGGQRSISGNFMQMGYMAWWWTSYDANESYAKCFDVEADYPDAGMQDRDKSRGYSVRCVKD